MDARTRKIVGTFDLPEQYQTEKHDNFVNWDNPDHKLGDGNSIKSARVVRVIGPKRCLMLFGYDTRVAPIHRGTPFAANHHNYRVMYLNEHGDLVGFDPKALHEAAKTKRNQYPSWDRVIGEWLVAHGAMTFTGRGWAEHLEMRIKNLITRWERHYNTNLYPVGK